MVFQTTTMNRLLAFRPEATGFFKRNIESSLNAIKKLDEVVSDVRKCARWVCYQ